jgi:hypothetical protein
MAVLQRVLVGILRSYVAQNDILRLWFFRTEQPWGSLRVSVSFLLTH